MESEKKRFKIISTGAAAEAIDLELDPFIQQEHGIELTGQHAEGRARDGERQRDAAREFRRAVPLFQRRPCRREKPVLRSRRRLGRAA